MCAVRRVRRSLSRGLHEQATDFSARRWRLAIERRELRRRILSRHTMVGEGRFSRRACTRFALQHIDMDSARPSTPCRWRALAASRRGVPRTTQMGRERRLEPRAAMGYRAVVTHVDRAIAHQNLAAKARSVELRRHGDGPCRRTYARVPQRLRAEECRGPHDGVSVRPENTSGQREGALAERSLKPGTGTGDERAGAFWNRVSPLDSWRGSGERRRSDREQRANSSPGGNCSCPAGYEAGKSLGLSCRRGQRARARSWLHAEPGR